MSGASSVASEQAMQTNKELAQGYYGIGIPALRGRQEQINASLAGGEPAYLAAAFSGQRAALSEATARQGGAARSQQMEGAGAALSGGNQFANMNPADIGAQLANALYGSRFAEGQASIDQTMNLMGMALGGAGTAGNSGLSAAQNQLGAIRFMPGYDPTYANVVGGLAGGASLYGAMNKAGWFDPSKPPSSGSGSGVSGWG